MFDCQKFYYTIIRDILSLTSDCNIIRMEKCYNPMLNNIIGIFTECTDNYNKKSSYKLYNDLQNFYNLLDQQDNSNILFTLSPSYHILPCLKNKPHIWAPYFLNPSVINNPFISLYDSIENHLVISSNRSDITMNYRLSTLYREKIYNIITNTFNKYIYCGGKFRHNDNRLKPVSLNYSIIDEYLVNFKFSIAIENEFFPGYISEKLIDPLLAGTVPIYYDKLHQFPDYFINPKSCIILNDDNINNINWIKNELDKDFSGIPVFADTAKEWLEEKIYNDRKIIEKII